MIIITVIVWPSYDHHHCYHMTIIIVIVWPSYDHHHYLWPSYDHHHCYRMTIIWPSSLLSYDHHMITSTPPLLTMYIQSSMSRPAFSSWRLLTLTLIIIIVITVITFDHHHKHHHNDDDHQNHHHNGIQFEGGVTWFQVWPPGGVTCINSNFGHKVALLTLVVNLTSKWR